MWKIDKILVPTDFSECAESALGLAKEMASKFGASIVLLHTYQSPIYGFPGGAVPGLDIVHAMQRAGQEGLNRLMDREKSSGIPIETELIQGMAWEEILTAAQKHKVGLIVMGTHGRHGVPRALLGSVAEKVVRQSSVPVLTVHHAESAKS